MRWRVLAFGMLVTVAAVGGAGPADAHRDGCHRWHSCPSDSGSYSCGDAGYACRYPTYDESQRGSIYDPTYEDYGFTDTGTPDYDYPYSDACPTGCGATTGVGTSGSSGGSSGSIGSGGDARSVTFTPASTSTPAEDVNWGPWVFGGVVILGGLAWFGKRAPATATRSATPSRPPTSRPPTTRSPTTRRPTSRPSAGSRSGSKCSCGGTMVVRRRRSDGHKFLGCSRFPKCRRTRSL